MFKFSTSLTWLQPFLTVCSLLTLNGCATTEYTTYYALFESENSAGDWRQFRLHWQTVHREGWGGDSDSVLPVVLEAQCSHRKLYFYDQSFSRNRQCGDTPGIHYCGKADQDVNPRGEPIESGRVCASLTDKHGATMIRDLSGDVTLNVRCRPSVLERQGLEEKENLDYLLTSEQPYKLSIKHVKGGGREVENYLPQLFNHSSVCDPDS